VEKVLDPQPSAQRDRSLAGLLIWHFTRRTIKSRAPLFIENSHAKCEAFQAAKGGSGYFMQIYHSAVPKIKGRVFAAFDFWP
jgi:hypothetical protein